MDSKKHSRLTGGKSVVSREVGGKFSTFDGYADGENLKLVPDRKIVQTWRASDWPPGVYSEVKFLLNGNEAGTLITFTQTGVPFAHLADIAQGWWDYYWEPMKKLLKK